MPFCQKCGSPLPADSRFCTNCGAPVVQTRPRASAAAAVQTEIQSARYTVILEPVNPKDQKYAQDILIKVAGLEPKTAESSVKLAPMEIADHLTEKNARALAGELLSRGLKISVYNEHGRTDLEKWFPGYRQDLELRQLKVSAMERDDSDIGAYFLGKKLPQKGLRSFLPPGFRTGSLVKMLLAIPAYLFGFSVSAELALDLMSDGACFTLGWLSAVLLTCNYRGAWRLLPKSFRKRGPLGRAAILTFLDFMILFAAIVLSVFIGM